MTALWVVFGLVAVAVVAEVAPSWGAFLLVLVVLGMLYTATRRGVLT